MHLGEGGGGWRHIIGSRRAYSEWALFRYIYHKATFLYEREKFMRICQNGPLDKSMRFLFMCSSALCIATYSAIKIYAV